MVSPKGVLTVGDSRTMPQETAIALDLGVLALFETLEFALALNAEHVLNLVVYGVCLSLGIVEVMVNFDKFLAVVIQRRHLVHAETLELLIKLVDAAVVLQLVLEHSSSLLHVRQALEQFNLLLKGGVVSNGWWTVAAKVMRDHGKVVVG